MTWESTPEPLAQALDAVRGMADSGDGLITVLLHDNAVVAVEHWHIEDVDVAAVVATARGADSAIFLVVGNPRHAGRAMVAANSLHAQLTEMGISVGAVVHVPELKDGAVWTDLSAANPHSGNGILAWASSRLRALRRTPQAHNPALPASGIEASRR